MTMGIKVNVKGNKIIAGTGNYATVKMEFEVAGHTLRLSNIQNVGSLNINTGLAVEDVLFGGDKELAHLIIAMARRVSKGMNIQAVDAGEEYFVELLLNDVFGWSAISFDLHEDYERSQGRDTTPYISVAYDVIDEMLSA